MGTAREKWLEAKKELELLEKKIEEEEREETRQRQLPLREAAQLAHGALCQHNHTDGCGWNYEITRDEDETWRGSAHKSYLMKIERVMKEHNIALPKLMSMLEEFARMKNAHPYYRRAMHTLTSY